MNRKTYNKVSGIILLIMSVIVITLLFVWRFDENNELKKLLYIVSIGITIVISIIERLIEKYIIKNK